MRSVVLLLALGSCAALDTARMSESCRNLYNACLNTCPSADSNSRVPPGPNVTTVQPMADVASCTNACNEQAKKCQ